jgi:SAM-dependent methyltransferase
VRFAVDLLDPGPADRLLEAGCGPGVAAGLVCARLDNGRLLAIDRSPLAVRRTLDRNREHVAAGRLELRTVALDRLTVEPGSFDAAFSVDVNLFWAGPANRELAVLHAALRPGGVVYLCFGAGPQPDDRVAGLVHEALRRSGFVEVAGHRGDGVLAVSGRTRG